MIRFAGDVQELNAREVQGTRGCTGGAGDVREMCGKTRLPGGQGRLGALVRLVHRIHRVDANQPCLDIDHRLPRANRNRGTLELLELLELLEHRRDAILSMVRERVRERVRHACRDLQDAICLWLVSLPLMTAEGGRPGVS